MLKLYVVSGEPRSGKSQLCMSLVGPQRVWRLSGEVKDFLQKLRFAPIHGGPVAIDGVRNLPEVWQLRQAYPSLVHFHCVVANLNESDPASEDLAKCADYLISWSEGDNF